MNRATLVKLGQAGKPWSFIEACCRQGVALGAGADPGLTFLLAKNAADLGLVTVANRVLDQLSGPAAGAPPVASLRETLVAAKDRLVPVDDRVSRAAALRHKLVLSEGNPAAIDAALSRVASLEAAFLVSIACDGQELRTANDLGDIARWQGPWSAEGVEVLDAIEPLDLENAPPITLEGLSSPALLARLGQRTTPRSSGYQRGIYVVEPSIDRVLEAAAASDAAAGVLGEARTKLFTGPDGGDRFTEFLESRHTVEAIGPWVGSPTPARAAERLHAAAREKAAFVAELQSRVLSRSPNRDAEFWADRYRSARTEGRPLRVLIPTCRLSTYIQYSSQGLVDAFVRAGHEAQVVIEPDASTMLSSASFLDACDRFDPDLIVLINFPRATRPDSFPSDVPFVCWIQDHMPQIYDESVGLSQGTLDFTVGHTPPELYEQLRFPAAQSLSSPVVVNPADFYEGPVAPGDRAQFECDLAYVSHQSETFDDLAARLRSELASGAQGPRASSLASVIDLLVPAVRSSVENLATAPISPSLRLALWDAMDHAGLDRSDAGLEATLLHAAAWPLAERLVRHRTLDWAADLADRDGLRLKIHGNGWDRHPRFARYAAGPLEHGEALRSSYAYAKIHLHPTTRAAVHQRVLECVLSGGFPLVSFYLDATPIDTQLAGRFELDPDAASGRTQAGDLVFHRADYPELLRDALWRQEIGLPVSATIEVDEAYLRARNAAPRPAGDMLSLPAALFPSLRPFVFTDRDDFESRVRTLLDDVPDRRRWAGVLKRRVQSAYTLDGLVGRLIPFIEGRLDAAATRSKPTKVNQDEDRTGDEAAA